MILNSYGRDKRIAIYPFGYVGQLVKTVLNNAYFIQEDYIFDEEMSRYNDKIKKLEDCDEEELKDMVVLIASDKVSLWDEIRENAKKYFKEDNIFDIFGKVCVNRDVRIESLRLNAERINALGVAGSVAEVGVYYGEFSREINKYFSEKKLYLFDTFEGFLNEKVKKETDIIFMSQLSSLYNSDYCAVKDVSSILDGFPHPEKCVIKKGYFPDTVVGVEDNFAFVSLDVDIYVPTKAALEFFWPRMESNGIIMVHDYNNCVTKGVKKAVDEYCMNNNIPVVLMADWAGSAVLIKS